MGNVTVKIYRSETRGRFLYTLVYRDTNRARVKKSFADLENAKLEAQAAATKIQNGQIDVLELKSADRVIYQHALRLLQPTGRPLDLAAAEYAEASKILQGIGSIVEAARYFVRYHRVALETRTMSEVYEEFLSAKTADKASRRYLQDIRSRLGRLKEHFRNANIAEITEKELEDWVCGLGCGPVARNSARALVITLFRFASQKGYLTRGQPTAAEAISLAKEAPSAVGIFRPEQLQEMLNASSGAIQLYLALGAFSGLRHSELMRLDWAEIKLAQKHIEVTAGKAKTAQRRIVPIQPNLRAWIMLQCKNAGPIFIGEPMVARGIRELAKRLRDAGKHITIETAGTIAPEGIACDLASLSPKLGNSTPLEGEIAEGWRERHEATRFQPELLREWMKRYPFQLKFVVERSSDVQEIEALLAKVGLAIPPYKVQLMPQGTELGVIRGRDESLIDLCKQRGYRYCNRLHIELFGNIPFVLMIRVHLAEGDSEKVELVR